MSSQEDRDDLENLKTPEGAGHNKLAMDMVALSASLLKDLITNVDVVFTKWDRELRTKEVLDPETDNKRVYLTPIEKSAIENQLLLYVSDTEVSDPTDGIWNVTSTWLVNQKQRRGKDFGGRQAQDFYIFSGWKARNGVSHDGFN
eukprot:TRINITY_DN6608_c0_g2_i29.p2 TRINITY_DN6608_c0_g2~~TRINITY_DN6608_c0_g2_i29.p2  ORF type:complete len:145 (+),score=27.14 TRINITY_DN6608_c0_g2_i29:754-1188(+)